MSFFVWLFHKKKNKQPHYYMKSSMLLDDLRKNNILSKQKLLSIIDQGILGENCYNSDDLKELFNFEPQESRVYKENIKLNRAIIRNTPRGKIRFSNSKSIVLIDCIFFCNIEFDLDRMNPTGGVDRVVIDNCLILGNVTFSGNHPDLLLSWTGLSCYNLSFSTSLKKLIITNSNIFHLACTSLNVTDEVIFSNNNITLLEFYNTLECDFIDYNNNFDPKKLPIIKKEFTKKPNSYTKLRDKFNLFNFGGYYYILSKEAKSEKVYSLYSTFNTLRQSKNNSRSIDFNAKLNYNFYYHYPRLNIFQKGIIYLTQAFLRPTLFFLYSILTIFCAAIFYYFFLFEKQTFKTLLDSIYFSIITFTTTGYGDMTPSGNMKFIACGESILGIILISFFTVSLVRKYFEKHN